jgi:lipopolysaccharide/colanic/teichoic acid biosynthesis glycosyltransferase
MLIVPLVACTLLVRLTFEVLAGAGEAWRIAGAVFGSAALGTGAMLALAAALQQNVSASGTLLAFVGTVTALAGGAGLRSLELRLGALSRRLFFLGTEEQYDELSREVRRRGDMALVGFFSVAESRRLPTGKLVDHVLDARATTLVMSAAATIDESLVAVASAVHLRGVRVRPLGIFYELHFAKVPLSDLTQAWFFFDVAEIHRPRLYGAFKRVWETSLAALLLVLSAPLLPFIALAVRLSSPGSVLYRQRRIGKNRREIELVKFRTMRVAESPEGWATQEGARITPVGRWLRKYRLDEIPQLWHVVRGDLALVGPRPEQPHLVAELERSIEYYETRHHVRPGVTGWAQVKCGYGGSVQGTADKLQYEFYYLKHQSLRLDLLVVYETIRTVLTGRGF